MRLVVQLKTPLAPEEMLELAAQVYQGLAAEQIDQIEQIVCDRCNFLKQ